MVCHNCGADFDIANMEITKRYSYDREGVEIEEEFDSCPYCGVLV
jgi:DNA-directed RNA polymerase subunit RPC12/RpoP